MTEIGKWKVSRLPIYDTRKHGWQLLIKASKGPIENVIHANGVIKANLAKRIENIFKKVTWPILNSAQRTRKIKVHIVIYLQKKVTS